MVRGETDKSTGLVEVSPQDTDSRGLNILKTRLGGTEESCPQKPAQNHTVQPIRTSAITRLMTPNAKGY